MTQRSLIAVAVAGALMFGGCDNQGKGEQAAGSAPAAAKSAAAAAAVKPENIVATVNGKPIAKSAVDMQRRGAHGADDEKIVDELISRELLRQDAEKQNLLADPAAAERLDSMMRIALSQIAAEHFMKTAQITDEELKKEYDQRVGAMKNIEYKARHILVDSEAAAKDVIAKLQKGAKFEDLAKKLSKDPGSKANGGDLGWFNPQQMVPPFSGAVAALKNGEITQAPVQTQFGWHVIQREDSREQQPPALDAVKDQLKMMLQTQRLQQHIDALKTAAKIDRPQPPKAAEPPAAKPQAPAEQKAPAEAGTPAKPAAEEAAKPAEAEPAEPAEE